jgi:hypothetical protein
MGADLVYKGTSGLSKVSLVCGGGEKERTDFLGEIPGGLKKLNGYTEWKEVELKENNVQLLDTADKTVWLEAKLNMLYVDKTTNLPSNGEFVPGSV